jgi:Kae1-associated kinase Bud32
MTYTKKIKKHLIKIGAEAIIYSSSWLGKKVVVKERVPKKYRLKALDDKLRTERIRKEIKLMVEARRIGIPIPIIYDIDFLSYKIVMEHIGGKQVKEILSYCSRRTAISICKKIGIMIAKLHKHDIIHGDLTTSNMLLVNDRIYLIDFSLGEKSAEIEAKGVDLHLLKEAFASAHSALPDCFEIVLKTYCKSYKYGTAVKNRIYEIERRARYT